MIVIGRPYVHQYEYASRSPPALVPAYGERGLSGWSSVMGSDSAVPYTSDEDMRMNRSIGRSRIASSSTWVPTTLVVTNSPPPCSIAFEGGCDVGQVADVAVDEPQPLVLEHVGQVGQVPGVGEGVHRDDLVRRLLEEVADHVRGDEP